LHCIIYLLVGGTYFPVTYFTPAAIVSPWIHQPYPRKGVRSITETLLVGFLPWSSIVLLLQFKVLFLPFASRVQLKEGVVGSAITLDELGDTLLDAVDDGAGSRVGTLTFAGNLSSVVHEEAVADSTDAT
jgi:hypothetical protein